MIDSARDHLNLWLEHNVAVARRKFGDDMHALDNKSAAEGWYLSGRRIKEAIRLAADAINALLRPTLDKVGTLPEVSDRYEIARQGLEGFAGELLEKTNDVVRGIERGQPTSPAIWKSVRGLQEPILTDLRRQFELAAFAGSQQTSRYLPPAIAGWDVEASKAEMAQHRPLPPILTLTQAAIWIAYRDEGLTIGGGGRGISDPDLASEAYQTLGEALFSRTLVGYGLREGGGWEPVPAEALLPAEEITLEPTRLQSYSIINVSRFDLFALFPPNPAPSVTAEINPAAAIRKQPKRDARPPLPEALLRGWWAALGKERDSLPLDQLWRAAQAVYPANHVARGRVRALGGARKPGPKQNAE